MKKIIIIIGIIIAVFVVWSIVDQPCQPPPSAGIELEKDCYPEPRWIKWTTVINNWYDDNRGTKDMRHDGPEQLQDVLDHCAYQRLAEAQNYTASDGTLMMVDAIGFNYENSTHAIDNNNCEWHEKPVFTGIRLLPGNTDDIRLNEVLDSCACFAGDGPCKLPGLSWSNDTHSIDNNTCEWEITSPVNCESGPSPNDEFYYYDEELCELIPIDIDDGAMQP